MKKSDFLKTLTAAWLATAFAPPAFSVPLPKPRPVPRHEATAAVQPPVHQAPAAAIRPPAAPQTRPVQRPNAPAAIANSQTSQADMDTLERVLELVHAEKPTEATQAAATISDRVARKLSEWLILRSGYNGASVERYRAFLQDSPDWPSQSFMKRRAEAALWDDRRDNAAVLAYFSGNEPLSGKGRLALARALLAQGNRAEAERLVRLAWRKDELSKDIEAAVLEQFDALLTSSDHRARMEMLLFEDGDAAMRSAQRIGGHFPAIARARIAVNRKAGNAKTLMDAVPADARHDPSYIYARVVMLRRADKEDEAAKAMLTVPRDAGRLGDIDEWWKQRRALSRAMLDQGDNRTAYLLCRDAAVPPNDIYKTEREFMAGWIALRYLDDPATAAQHFQRLDVDSPNPTRAGKAGYWQGRAAEAMGRTDLARGAYELAAQHSTDYYGQLARARLGLPQLGLRASPAASRSAGQFEVVRAVELLYALEEKEFAATMLSGVASERPGDTDMLAALAELASRNNDATGQYAIGKAALNAGHAFDTHAFPTSGIPAFKQIGPEVDRSVVFAIARQESGFNQAVVSPANAYGLMQVTAGAGIDASKRYGATFDRNRMKSDPVYNATLGAAELAGLLEDYRGSYVMTFAGYNAGRGRVRTWVQRYGDPRDPKVDAVDWVERIPFAETRNYVQRIMENLQVYRARFGGGTQLMIEADLKRGSATQ